MQAAQILAGYSLGGADLLRRAMGKKIQSEMDEQRAIFVAGCAEHNQIDTAKANELFDLIDKFAGYGFNKSHAAAYALLSYHTGWLKRHHPEAFYAASMCFDMHQTDKLAVFVDDMRRMGTHCLPPSINQSDAEYSVEADEQGLAVRYALAGIKNVGEKAMESLVAERETNGLFKNLDDFANRADPAQINRRSLENLASSGAFDGFEANRASVFGGIETILATAQSARQQRESGQGGLFGGEADAGVGQMRLPNAEKWSVAETMEHEREAFGFYFSSHPISQFTQIAASHGAKSYLETIDCGPIPEGNRKSGTMAAMVQSVKWRESRRGNRFVQAEFSDSSGQFQASCFDEGVCASLAEWVKSAECLLLNVEMDLPSGEEIPRIAIRSAKPLAGLVSNTQFKMLLDIKSVDAFLRLQGLILPLGGGRGEVVARTRTANGKTADIVLGRKFRLDVELVEKVKDIQGVENVELAPVKPHLMSVR